MYENDLYLLVDQIITMITLSIWIITFAFLYLKSNYELHKLNGYMTLKENGNGLQLDYYKLKYDYKSKKLDYQVRLQESKNFYSIIKKSK